MSISIKIIEFPCCFHTKEDLIKKYWESMNTLDGYLKHKPYNYPEILIFEPVPAKLIEYIE